MSKNKTQTTTMLVDLTAHTVRPLGRFMRTVASVVLISFSTVTLSPGAQAIAQTVESASAATKTSVSEDTHTQAVERVKTRLKSLAANRSKGASISGDKAALRGLRDELRSADDQTLAEFDAVAAHLSQHNLPEEIKQRQRDAVAKFKAEADKLQSDLTTLDGATSTTDIDTKTQALRTRLEGMKSGRPHQAFDPKNLPFQSPSNKIREPKTTSAQFTALFPNKINPNEMLASLNPMLQLATAITPTVGAEYLAQTEDVQITQRIKDLASQLNNNPVEIYNWVRNNIEYLPTYGSIQGSDLTLQTKRGNAFDTSSLLIALLRAANIPARYVYGTVDIPAEKVMNWVGGVTAPAAAMDLLAQGGVPVKGLAQGGVIKTIRMEHVWVEAYVDYLPSRGAINKEPDSWIPLDASFKQYTYTLGLDIKQVVPLTFDPIAVINLGSQVDGTTGAVQNLSQVGLLAATEDYQASVNQYLASSSQAATIDQILGVKKINEKLPPVIAASLPYRVLVTANRFVTLPSTLRHYIQLALFNSAMDQMLEAPVLTQSISLPNLGSKRLGVTYKPATAADELLIQSYPLKNASLPAYLLNVIPVIQVDGVDVGTGSPLGMGQDQYWQVTLAQPDNANAHVHSYIQAAGDEIVFGLNRNGVTEDVIKNRVARTDTSAAESLNLIALHYWLEADISNVAIASAYGVAQQRLPSVGVFASPLTVIYSYGVPRQSYYKSREVDISRSLIAAVGKEGQLASAFMTTSGVQASLLEGRVLEQVVGAPPGSGNSAIQLLIDAGNQGIPLYTINSSNAALIVPQLSIDAELQESIAAAAAAGQTVIASQRAADRLDWSGMGYVVLDPQTGAGAYLIKGGLNGGELAECERQTQPITIAVKQLVLTALLIAALAIAIAVAGASGGTLAPAAVYLLAIGLGLTTLAWPTNASANSCDQGCHRGRLQAQGNGLEKSVAWNQPTPLTLNQGLGLLESLKAQLTAKQLTERADGFAAAERFMRNAASNGGVCAGDIKSSLSFPPRIEIRVDIEVREGRAFTPD